MIRCRRKKLLLAAMAGGQPVPPKPTPESILAKMLREQPQLYNYLMLWYDPRLQGLTNAQIEDATIGQGYFILRNLQGSTTYNMRVYGMTGEEGDGYINEDGELVFDGFDDYSVTQSAIAFADFEALTAIAYIPKVHLDISQAYVNTSTANVVLMRNTDNSRARGTFLGSDDLSHLVEGDSIIYEFRYPSDVRKFNDREGVAMRSRILNTDSTLRLGYTSASVRSRMNFGVFVMFTRDISDTESAWVRDNMINY